jgi:hypothetical protein
LELGLPDLERPRKKLHGGIMKARKFLELE